MASAEEKPNKDDPSLGVEIRILGHVTTPAWKVTPTHTLNYIKVCDFSIEVKPETTIKEIKDITMARLTTLCYCQIEFQFWDMILKDAVTIKDVYDSNKYFKRVNCLDLFITMPSAKFKATYKACHEMGMSEEKALERTTIIMEQAKDKKFDYDIAMKFELCRERLQQCKLKFLKDCANVMPPKAE